jgi:hypothetical protein
VELTETLKETFITTAKQLKGSERRIFMARITRELGAGGQTKAEKELGWNRKTLRKGTKELESGVPIVDNFQARGRKRAEEHLPNLLTDMQEIVDKQSQTDPQFKSNRLYTRLSAAEVRRQLIAQKGYLEEDLPTATAIGYKLNKMGYHPSGVQKSKPKKR